MEAETLATHASSVDAQRSELADPQGRVEMSFEFALASARLPACRRVSLQLNRERAKALCLKNAKAPGVPGPCSTEAITSR